MFGIGIVVVMVAQRSEHTFRSTKPCQISLDHGQLRRLRINEISGDRDRIGLVHVQDTPHLFERLVIRE